MQTRVCQVILFTLLASACVTPREEEVGERLDGSAVVDGSIGPALDGAGPEAPAATPVDAAPAIDAIPVTLQIAWWGSAVRHQRTNDVIALFQRRYPHVQ